MDTLATVGFQLSLQQKELLNRCVDAPTAPLQLVLLLEGPLDRARLRQSFDSIVNRHEILRTTFQRSSGMKFPFQVVHPSASAEWSEHDLSEEVPETQAGKLAALLQAETFEWRENSGISACLVQLAHTRYLLDLRASVLATDAAGLKCLAGELVDRYEKQPDDITAALQYADYGEWQGEQLESHDEAAEVGRNYWARLNWAALPRPELPFTSSVPQVPFAACRTAALPFAQSVWEQLEAAGLDPAAALLSAWQVFLSRVGRAQHLAVGLLSDGRAQPELENAIGAFERVLPLNLSFELDRGFSDIANDAQKLLQEATEYQDYFGASNEIGALPVGFSIEKRFEDRKSGGVSFSVYRDVRAARPFDVLLRCVKAGDTWSACVECRSPRIWSDGAERIAKSLAALLTAAARQPESSVSLLPIVDEEEQQLLAALNQTAAPFSWDKCIHELFEEQARLTPERMALRFGDTALTYQQLNARGNQIGAYLRELGVTRNVPIGLCFERSAEMIVALLGILKAGGCYVPLAPDSPKARIKHQLAETAALAILTDERLQNSLPEFDGPVISIDRDREQFDRQPVDNLSREATPDSLVYIIYTSGSTGIPKGVAVRHANLVNYCTFIARKLKLNEYAEGLQFATVSTVSADLGNTSIFPALLSGGCLDVIGYETAMLSDLFAAYASRYPIDVLKITPTHLASLMNGGDGDNVLPRKFLIAGGEALNWKLFEEIRRLSKCKLINHYGPTEATVGCCTFEPGESAVTDWGPATVPIGRPIDNDEVYIVDEHLNPVPIGARGELCVAGEGLAAGYFNQPQQTAERFVEHRFSREITRRVYRTGDLARLLPDGNIEFLGRIDQQVKIRGFRVEPAEIETALREHPGVKQSVVLSCDGELAAYIVPTQAVSESDLRAFLRERLPDYMIPSRLLMLDRLPLTANGKIDTRALAKLQTRSDEAPRDAIAPRNTDEQRIAAIWAEVLSGRAQTFEPVSSIWVDIRSWRLRSFPGCAMPIVCRFLCIDSSKVQPLRRWPRAYTAIRQSTTPMRM